MARDGEGPEGVEEGDVAQSRAREASPKAGGETEGVTSLSRGEDQVPLSQENGAWMIRIMTLRAGRVPCSGWRELEGQLGGPPWWALPATLNSISFSTRFTVKIKDTMRELPGISWHHLNSGILVNSPQAKGAPKITDTELALLSGNLKLIYPEKTKKCEHWWFFASEHWRIYYCPAPCWKRHSFCRTILGSNPVAEDCIYLKIIKHWSKVWYLFLIKLKEKDKEPSCPFWWGCRIKLRSERDLEDHLVLLLWCSNSLPNLPITAPPWTLIWAWLLGTKSGAQWGKRKVRAQALPSSIHILLSKTE